MTQRSEYYARTGDATSLELTSAQARAVSQHQSALLWDASRQQWWKEVSKLRAKRGRRSVAAFLTLVWVLILAGGGAYWLFDRNRTNEVNQDIEFVMSADYGQVLLALSDAVDRGFGPKQIVELLEETNTQRSDHSSNRWPAPSSRKREAARAGAGSQIGP